MDRISSTAAQKKVVPVETLWIPRSSWIEEEGLAISAHPALSLKALAVRDWAEEMVNDRRWSSSMVTGVAAAMGDIWDCEHVFGLRFGRECGCDGCFRPKEKSPVCGAVPVVANYHHQPPLEQWRLVNVRSNSGQLRELFKHCIGWY